MSVDKTATCTNMIITGVGGQGNVLAARLLAQALLDEGYEVAVGDVFGLAQRGGSVASHVRWTKGETLPPLVPSRSLHVLLAFEPMEALRVLTAYGCEDTVAIINDTPVMPIGVQAGRLAYPELEVLWQGIRDLTREQIIVKATAIARELGEIQALNMVMLGALAGSDYTGLNKNTFLRVIEQETASRHLQTNLLAFEKGLEQSKVKRRK